MGSISTLTEGDVTITSFEITDLRFPTSLDGVGSDAMHVGTNGSHPYIQLKTNHGDLIGEGIVSFPADRLVSNALSYQPRF
jgi:L-galactonate dehydratase